MITLASRVFSCTSSALPPNLRFFAQCVWATLAQLLGSASPYVGLRVRGVAVTYSVCVSGGGFNSFLGFEYGGVITLASRVFRILLPLLPSSLRFLSSVLWLRWPSCWAPLAQMLG